MAMAATPSRPGDHETEFTRPGVSEDEIEEIKKVFTMMDTQNGKRPARGQLDPNQLMEAMNALGIVWKKSDVYQTLAEVDHDNSGTVDEEHEDVHEHEQEQEQEKAQGEQLTLSPVRGVRRPPSGRVAQALLEARARVAAALAALVCDQPPMDCRLPSQAVRSVQACAPGDDPLQHDPRRADLLHDLLWVR